MTHGIQEAVALAPARLKKSLGMEIGPWELGDVLDAVDGIAYAVDLDYRISAVGRTRWNESATNNGAPELGATLMLGQNLFDFIQGDDVREIYRRSIEKTMETLQPVALAMRCDSPEIRRELRLAITPLRTATIVRGVLFQSLAVDEQVRPPMDLFDFKALIDFTDAERLLPLVSLCSFCARVKQAASPAESAWIDAEEYYQLGGTSKVRISHGLCPECYREHYEM
jgi:hypothetical protein